MAYQKSLTIDIFDSDFNYLGLIDTANDVFFKRSWYEIGDFSIKFNPNTNPTYAALLAKNNIVMFNKDPYRSGILTTITDDVGSSGDGKGSQWRTAKGYELKQLFQWRIISNFNYTTSDNGPLWHYSGPAESAMKALINDQCGPGSLSFGDGGKQFPLLEIATDQGRGPNYVINERGSNVYSVLFGCASAALVGWYCYLDVANKKIIMDCGLGLDRTTDQSANPWAIFSTDRDTLQQASIDDSIDGNYANTLYVQGQTSTYMAFPGSDSGGGEPTGMLRHEKFIDSTQTAATATESELAQLTTLGLTDLQQYSQTLTLSGAALPYGGLIYRDDYDIGDNVVVYNGENAYSAQLLSVEEEWKNAYYQLTMDWGKPALSSTRQLFQQANIAKGTAITATNGVNSAAAALAAANSSARAWEQTTAPTIGSARPDALNGDTWFNTMTGAQYTAMNGVWVIAPNSTSLATGGNTVNTPALFDMGDTSDPEGQGAAIYDCGIFTDGTDSAATLVANYDCGSTS